MSRLLSPSLAKEMVSREGRTVVAAELSRVTARLGMQARRRRCWPELCAEKDPVFLPLFVTMIGVECTEMYS